MVDLSRLLEGRGASPRDTTPPSTDKHFRHPFACAARYRPKVQEMPRAVSPAQSVTIRATARPAPDARFRRMHHLPNLITLVRLALVPALAYALLSHAYHVALPLFLAAALSDTADGYIARRYHATSRLGATLDPIADKLNMLVATLALAWQELVPLWLAGAIVLRDVVIVTGALAYRATVGHLEIAPTWLSKINTVIEFTLLLVVMAGATGWIDVRGWIGAAFVLAGATVIASGVQYVWLWGRKAWREVRSR